MQLDSSQEYDDTGTRSEVNTMTKSRIMSALACIGLFLVFIGCATDDVAEPTAVPEILPLEQSPDAPANDVLAAVSALQVGMSREEVFDILAEHGMRPSGVCLGDSMSWGHFFSLSKDYYLSADFRAVGSPDPERKDGVLRSVTVQLKGGSETNFVAFGVVLPSQISRPSPQVKEHSRIGTVSIATTDEKDDVETGFLVLTREGEPNRNWTLGGLPSGTWAKVPLHRSAVGKHEAFRVTWLGGQGTGLGVRHGAILWFNDGEPAFWSGVWERTENFEHPGKGYNYIYTTELVLYPEGDTHAALLVSLAGKSVKQGPFSLKFVCRPTQDADGNRRFLVTESSRDAIGKLLAMESLSGLHSQLRSFLGPGHAASAGNTGQ
jgi:hypothetical protein